ncbi:unnamed protein product, partial [Heterosigma akashiwo]
AGDLGAGRQRRAMAPSRFRRAQEARGEMTDGMRRLINTTPFPELRAAVEAACAEGETHVLVEVLPGEVTASFIVDGVTRVMTGSWDLKCQPHRIWYEKVSGWARQENDNSDSE